MIKLSYRFSILIFLIVIIIIALCFCKYSDEYFFNQDNISLMPSLQFNNEDYIVFLHKNNDNIKNKVYYEYRQTIFKKSINFYYSNIKIYSPTDLKNGFLFKPIRLKDLTIGFNHFENKEIDNNNILSNLNFSFKINDNNLKIVEDGLEEIIDFCADPNIRLCSSDRDLVINNNHLGMVIHNSYIHYIMVTRNKNNLKGVLIHRSKKPIKYPINLCIINKSHNNIMNDILWLSSYISTPIDLPWSVEYERKNIYNEKPIPKKKPLNRETEVEVIAPPPTNEEIDPFYKLPAWSKKIEILNASRQNDLIKLKVKFHNIDQLYLNRMYQIKVKVWHDDNNKLSIPLDQELKMINKVIDNIFIDLSSYGNIFYKKDIKVQVIGLISEFANDTFNMNSNVVNL